MSDTTMNRLVEEYEKKHGANSLNFVYLLRVDRDEAIRLLQSALDEGVKIDYEPMETSDPPNLVI